MLDTLRRLPGRRLRRGSRDMFRKILAGTDGSDSAMLALAHAANLAEKLSAELTVVSAHARTGRPDSSVEAGHVIAGALLRDVEKRYGNLVDLRTRALAGAAADVLVDMAEQEGFDLVVVGNRGMARSALVQPSSVPGRVTRRSPVAALVVDTVGGRPPGYGRILVGTDASATAAVAVESAIALASALDAELAIATAVASDGEGRRVLESIRNRWADLSTHVMAGEPSEALCVLAESGEYDLLVLGNKGISGLRRALGSVPARVLRRSPASVLIINTAG